MMLSQVGAKIAPTMISIRILDPVSAQDAQVASVTSPRCFTAVMVAIADPAANVIVAKPAPAPTIAQSMLSKPTVELNRRATL